MTAGVLNGKIYMTPLYSPGLKIANK